MRISGLGALSVLAVPILLPAMGAADEAAGYLRYPDIHGDSVVFVAEGDMWLAAVGGGNARRLTRHLGGEYFPQFSPDGSRIAFTGEYDGNADVYVIAAEGGEPRRLTWHPARDEVLGWTPDGTRILFRSRREEPNRSYELFTIPASGGDAEKLPLGWVARLDMDPESGRWAFTRTERERRNWKRYRGGTATSIWVGQPEEADFREVTDFEGKDAFPMWHDGRIYFLSDQGGTANIWSMKPDGRDRRRHTDLGDWDARYPSMGPEGRIVFMLAGDIRLFEPGSGRQRKLDVQLPSDRMLTRVRYPGLDSNLTWFELAPDGERVALTMRGEIFSVPVEKGVTLPLTRGSGARESWGKFDREGKRLVYVSDESGEEEIRIIDAWGRGKPLVVKPAGDSGWHFWPEFSPDGRWIAWADQTQTLHVMPAEGGESVAVDRDPQEEIRSYTWSPDGRWLAYARFARTDYASIFIYDTRSGEKLRVTDDTTHDYAPAWDPEGRYLYFLSDRVTNPLLGIRDMRDVNIRPTKPHLVLLRKDEENPFAHLAGLPADEDEEDGEKRKSKKKKKKKKKSKKDEEDEDEDAIEPIAIDWDGLAERVVPFPVKAGIYSSLSATASHVFYLSHPIQGMADWGDWLAEEEPDAKVMAFELEEKEAETFMEGVSATSLAPRADKIAVMKGRGEIYVVDTEEPPEDELEESKLSLDGVVIELDPREEWRQIYYEGWRHMRDFYWDASMGGLDWKALRDQYATLLPRLATRDDLRDLMGELIGELRTSHTYVWGGDQGVRVPSVPIGLLGARLSREGDSFRVERIYRGAAADNQRSPLLEPGVGVREGDYILAVNRRPFETGLPVYAAFEGLAEQRVLLTVNDSPSSKGARDVVVVPLGSDSPLRYADWVRRNREYVAEKTEGKLGYVHLPDMGSEGLITFNTWFYPQLDREGMVVDCRWNGGGFVSQIILERFRRRLVSFDRARGGGVWSYPYRTLNGPFVVLTDEHAGSDGDIFPAAVQLEGLAPVIGKRSWGGVVGIRADKRMVDGGILTQPEFAWWDPVRGWGLENHGVDPDIEVTNLPQDLARGVDAQLDRGIEEVMRLRAAKPPVVPEFGPTRLRGRDAYEKELTQ